MKPRVGVSACLLGEAVRYDARSKPHAWVRGELARRAELVPLCPETGAGLAVPRPPVRLVRLEQGVRALGVEDASLDVTPLLEEWSLSMVPLLRQLRGLVLKSRSPSCGLGSVPLHSPDGQVLGLASGIFAEFLRRECPRLVLVEEAELDTTEGRESFLHALAMGG